MLNRKLTIQLVACSGVNRAENRETEEPAVAIVLCSEGDTSLICALPFTANEEISGGKVATRQAKKEATTR